MTKTKFGVGMALFIVLSLGLWQSALAVNNSEANGKSSNKVNVFNCTQVGRSIQIKSKKGLPIQTLKPGCFNAGHGMRNYAFTCLSEKQYRVEWEACHLAPAITQLQVKNPATGAILSYANSSYITLLNKYAAKQLVKVGEKVAALQLNLLTKNVTNTAQLTYAFGWVDSATGTINFDESLAKSLAAGAEFGSASNANLTLTDYYRGRKLIAVAFMRNNDGISKVPNMPVEVDDVIAIHVDVVKKVLPKPTVCEDVNGVDGDYSLCWGNKITHTSGASITYEGNSPDGGLAGFSFNGATPIVLLGEGKNIAFLSPDGKTVVSLWNMDILDSVTSRVKVRIRTKLMVYPESTVGYKSQDKIGYKPTEDKTGYKPY